MGERSKKEKAAAKDEDGAEVEKNNKGAAGGAEDNQHQQQGNDNKKKKEKGDKDDGGEGKKKASAAGVVVLRVDLHCHGCALKVKKAIKAAQGVESVRTEVAASTVTVSGNADPWDLKDRIETRAHKAVAFLSPPNPPQKKNKDDDDANKPAAGDIAKDKSSNKANKEPPESTVVLKIRLHCNGCIDRIKRTAQKIEGVKQVTVDTGKEQVTVTGTMDAKALPDVLRDKLKREVAVVSAAKKENNGGAGGDKKAAAAGDEKGGGGGGGDNHGEASSGSSGKKKNKNKKQQQQQQEEGEGDEEEKQQLASSMPAMEHVVEYPMFPTYGGGGGYRVEILHAPQLFSDENPNACSVM